MTFTCKHCGSENRIAGFYYKSPEKLADGRETVQVHKCFKCGKTLDTREPEQCQSSSNVVS